MRPRGHDPANDPRRERRFPDAVSRRYSTADRIDGFRAIEAPACDALADPEQEIPLPGVWTLKTLEVSLPPVIRVQCPAEGVGVKARRIVGERGVEVGELRRGGARRHGGLRLLARAAARSEEARGERVGIVYDDFAPVLPVFREAVDDLELIGR